MANKCDCEAPYGGEPHDLTECCGGHCHYVMCDSENCDIIHQFAYCEICGKNLTATVNELSMVEPASNCKDCGKEIDWEGDGGFLWHGLVFCDEHNPEDEETEQN